MAASPLSQLPASLLPLPEDESSDFQKLLVVLLHLGLDTEADPRVHHEAFRVWKNSYNGNIEVTMGCGGGDEGCHVVFVFNDCGVIKEHYVWNAE